MKRIKNDSESFEWDCINFQIGIISENVRRQEETRLNEKTKKSQSRKSAVRNCGTCRSYDGHYCFGYDPNTPRPKYKSQSCGKHRFEWEVGE